MENIGVFARRLLCAGLFIVAIGDEEESDELFLLSGFCCFTLLMVRWDSSGIIWTGFSWRRGSDSSNRGGNRRDDSLVVLVLGQKQPVSRKR